jgi:hypothetical protein
MTLTALPAPDIEIGLRRPVSCTLPLSYAHKCDPVHNFKRKYAAVHRAGPLLPVVVMARMRAEENPLSILGRKKSGCRPGRSVLLHDANNLNRICSHLFV